MKNHMTLALAAATAFTATVVGVVEVGPNVCQVDLLNPPEYHDVVPAINTITVPCNYIREPVEIEDPVLNVAAPPYED